MCDVPELQKIVIVLGGATCAMQQTMNVQWSYRTTMVQTGTKVKLLQHCLVRLQYSPCMARFNKYLYYSFKIFPDSDWLKAHA